MFRCSLEEPPAAERMLVPWTPSPACMFRAYAGAQLQPQALHAMVLPAWGPRPSNEYGVQVRARQHIPGDLDTG